MALRALRWRQTLDCPGMPSTPLQPPACPCPGSDAKELLGSSIVPSTTSGRSGSENDWSFLFVNKPLSVPPCSGEWRREA